MEREGMLRIFCVGVGGQGVLLATRLIGEASLMAGNPVSMSEVHGMAQRGGVVESTVVLGERLSPVLGDGEADIMIAFEPLEALRALTKCHRGTIAIVNREPIPPFSVTQGGAAYPPVDEIIATISGKIDQCYDLNALNLALEAGSDQTLNVVLVGFLTGILENIGNRIFPSRDTLIEALKEIVPARFFEINKKAFESGYGYGKGRAGSLA